MTGEEVVGPAGPKLVRLLYFVGAGYICTAAINKWRDIQRKSFQLPEKPSNAHWKTRRALSQCSPGDDQNSGSDSRVGNLQRKISSSRKFFSEKPGDPWMYSITQLGTTNFGYCSSGRSSLLRLPSTVPTRDNNPDRKAITINGEEVGGCLTEGQPIKESSSLRSVSASQSRKE